MLVKLVLAWSLALLMCFSSTAQETVLTGFISVPENWSTTLYLSVKNNYRTIDIVDASHIVASTQIDSSGNFSFPKSVFTDDERIYQLHISESENEIEVFISDFNEGGIGNNFLNLIADNKSKIRITPSKEGRIFGPIVSSNENTSSWQKLDQSQRNYIQKAYSNGDHALDYYISNYHDELIASSIGKSKLTKLLASHFLLKEDANLSSSYLESISDHLVFLEGLKSSLKNNYAEHRLQLSKELDLVKLQLDGHQSLSRSKGQVHLLSYIVFALGTLCLILILIIVRMRIKGKRTISPNLTTQEERIKALILKGATNKEIAQDLFISPSTVKTHINTLYKKEKVHSRKELLLKQN